MVLIPLGLYSKIKRPAYCCLLLGSAIVVFSVLRFQQIEQYELEFSKLLKGPKVGQIPLEVFDQALELCKSIEVENKCVVFTELKKFEEKKLSKVSKNDKKSRKLATVESQVDLVNNQNLIKHYLQKAQSSYLEGLMPNLYEAQVKSKLASFQNLKMGSLFYSAMSHIGWLHLIGNIFILLIFGYFVEHRIGGILFGIFLLIVSPLTLFVHLIMTHSSQICVGASGGIAGILGIFTVLFWSERMKVRFFAVVYSQNISLPVPIGSFFIFVANDIAGTIEASGNVAHIAHLSGFVIGAVFALVFKTVFPLNRHQVYPYETELRIQARKEMLIEKKLGVLENLIEINPDHFETYEFAFTEVLNFVLRNSAESEKLPVEDKNLEILRKLYMQYASEALDSAHREKKLAEALFIAKNLPILTNWEVYFKSCKSHILFTMYKMIGASEDDNLVALKLVDVALLKMKASAPIHDSILKRFEKLTPHQNAQLFQHISSKYMIQIRDFIKKGAA